MQQMRHEWVLRRAKIAYVPQPDSIPMPDNAASLEDKAKLYSIYLRPWVLDKDIASAAVPHITDLNRYDEASSCARTDGGHTSALQTSGRGGPGHTIGPRTRTAIELWTPGSLLWNVTHDSKN